MHLGNSVLTPEWKWWNHSFLSFFSLPFRPSLLFQHSPTLAPIRTITARMRTVATTMEVIIATQQNGVLPQRSDQHQNRYCRMLLPALLAHETSAHLLHPTVALMFMESKVVTDSLEMGIATTVEDSAMAKKKLFRSCPKLPLFQKCPTGSEHHFPLPQYPPT